MRNIHFESPLSNPYVVIPTYNEALNLETVVRQITQAVSNATVLVVDDNSPDGTGDIARELAAQGLPIKILSRPKKMGLGSAYRDGFAYSISNGASACVEIDADLSHDPKSIPTLLSALDAGHALAIGSRYVRGGSSPGLPPIRKLISRGGNWYASKALGITVKDATAGFRAYTVAILRRIDMDKIRADGYGFQIEMTFAVEQLSGGIAEVPIAFGSRTAGESKMDARIVIEAMKFCTAAGISLRLRQMESRSRSIDYEKIL